jgi:hypothetical protein
LAIPCKDFSVARFSRSCHLTPAEIFSVLLERCQLRQGVVTHQELAQRSFGRFVQHFCQQAAQAPAFGGQGFTDQLL